MALRCKAFVAKVVWAKKREGDRIQTLWRRGAVRVLSRASTMSVISSRTPDRLYHVAAT
jgi:hypothetical protein